MRGHRAIFADLKQSDRFSRNLADEMCAFCVKRNRSVYDEFIAADRGLPASVLATWSEPEARDYIELRAQVEVGPGEDAASLCDWSVRLIAAHFLASFEDNFQPYRIVDHEQRVLERMSALHLEDRIAHAIKDAARSAGIIIDGPLLRRMGDYWRFHAPRIEPPKLLGQLGDPGWCLSRATVIPDAAVPFPRWQSFTCRLNDPEAFGAFIAGLYFGLNRKGRQILWISEDGEGGKTQVLLALTRLVGERISKSINSRQLDGKHFSSAFVGKALALVPDNNNAYLIMSGAFKELSGSDLVSIEAKFKDARDTHLYCKAIIISNPEPVISSERANYSRTLWLKLAGLPKDRVIDVDWGDGLDAELPGFLHWALQCYHARCHDNYEIQVNAAVRHAKDGKVLEFEQRFTLALESCFKLDPAASCPAGELYSVLHSRTDGMGWTDLEIANFKRWLRARHDIEPTHNDNEHFYPGLRLKSVRDRLGGMGGIDLAGDDFVMPGYTGPQH